MASLGHVLVVEDDATSRGIISAVLQTEHLLVSQAATVEEAWQMVEREELDAIIMDVRLSGAVSGIELTKRIRDAFPSLKIIGLTADSTPETAERCKEGGMATVLVKPANKESLFRALRIVTRGRIKQGFKKVCLIVDDDATFRALVRERLLDKFGEGTVVLEAENGVKALEMVKENILDFILLDAAMPEMDGLTCAELIRSSEAAVQPKIIGVSADGYKGGEYSSAFDDFLSKPLKSFAEAFESLDSLPIVNTIQFLKVSSAMRAELVEGFVDDSKLVLELVQEKKFEKLSSCLPALEEASETLGAERAAKMIRNIQRSVDSKGTRFTNDLEGVLNSTIVAMKKIESVMVSQSKYWHN